MATPLEQMTNSASTNSFTNRESLEHILPQYQKTTINLSDISSTNIVSDICFDECLVFITRVNDLVLKNCKFRNCMLSIKGSAETTCRVMLTDTLVVNCAFKADDHVNLQVNQSTLKLCVMYRYIGEFSVRESTIEKSNIDLSATEINLQQVKIEDSIADMYCKSFYLYRNRMDKISYVKVHAWNDNENKEFSVTL